jgi:S-adenosylmethionine hydrolase
VPVVRTYADIPQGGLGVLMGSAGHLEIAARESAAAKSGAPARGAAVRVHLA